MDDDDYDVTRFIRVPRVRRAAEWIAFWSRSGVGYFCFDPRVRRYTTLRIAAFDR